MNGYRSFIAALEAYQGSPGRRVGKELRFRCPAHDDRDPSLDVREAEDGSPLVVCRSCGARLLEVAQALGREVRDFLPSRPSAAGLGDVVQTYGYEDSDGRLLFEVCRFEPKDFRQRRPDGAGGWAWNLEGVERVPYRLPELHAAVAAGRCVFVVEGEKDVETLRAQGRVATCNPGGAGKWRPEYGQWFEGARRVVVIADADAAGRAHAAKVADSLAGVAEDVRLLDLWPGFEDKRDVSYWFAKATDAQERQAALEALEQAARDAPRVNGRECPPEAVSQGARSLVRLDLSRMLAEPPEPVSWAVEPILVPGALTMLAGPAGEGKSMLALALGVAVAVANGEPVAGFKPQPGKVVIIDAENGEREIHRRMHALGLTVGAADRFAVYGAERFDLQRDLDDLDQVLAQERPYVLVLDSFRSMWTGEENDSGDVAKVLDPLRNLVRRHGCATLLLHHAPRGRADYRGSSAIAASCELIFVLGREQDDPDSARRYLACLKCRPAPQPAKRYLRLSVDLGMVFIDEAEPYGRDDADATRARPAHAATSPQILDLLQDVSVDSAMSLADVARGIGKDPKNGTVRRVLEVLVKTGQVTQTADKRFYRGCQGAKVPNPYVPGTLAPGTHTDQAMVMAAVAAEDRSSTAVGGT